eukprot:6209022-Pleurochrysis_carterae.AAC.1
MSIYLTGSISFGIGSGNQSSSTHRAPASTAFSHSKGRGELIKHVLTAHPKARATNPSTTRYHARGVAVASHLLALTFAIATRPRLLRQGARVKHLRAAYTRT